jgi:hypothetical protein
MDALAIETVAQKLYEASDPEATPWARRGMIIRSVWLAVAKDRLLKEELAKANLVS